MKSALTLQPISHEFAFFCRNVDFFVVVVVCGSFLLSLDKLPLPFLRLCILDFFRHLLSSTGLNRGDKKETQGEQSKARLCLIVSANC